jgi:hypothetical protein
MEMPQTHCYATGTVTLLWKRHQGSAAVDDWVSGMESVKRSKILIENVMASVCNIHITIVGYSDINYGMC